MEDRGGREREREIKFNCSCYYGSNTEQAKFEICSR